MVKNSKPRAAFLIGLLLSALVWNLIPSDSQAVQQQAANTPNASSVASVPVISDIEGVSITASVKSSKSFDYVFQRGDEIIYPEHLGYQIRFISDCKSSLIKGNQVFYVTCSPYRSSSKAPQPREGTEVQREEQTASDDSESTGAQTIFTDLLTSN